MSRRRLALRFAIATLLLAVAGLVLLVATGTHERIAGRMIERSLEEATGLEARLEKPEIGFFPLEARLGKVRLLHEGREVAGARGARARLHARPLLRGKVVVTDLAIDGPWLEYEPGLPSPSGADGGDPGRLRVDRFRLSNGRLLYRDDEAGLLVEAAGLSARSDRLLRDGRIELDAELPDARIQRGDLRLDGVRARASLRLDGSTLTIESFALEHSPSGSLELAGDVDVGSGEPDLSLRARLEAEAAALAPAGSGVRGRVQWNGTLEGTPSAWKVSGQVAAGDLGAGEMSLSGVSARLSATPREAELRGLEAALLGGRLEGDLLLEGLDAGGVLRFDMEAKGLDPALLPLPGLPAVLREDGATRLDLRARGEAPLADLTRARGTWALGLSPLRPNGPTGTFQGEVTEGLLRVRTGRLQYAGATLDAREVALPIAPDGSLEGLLALDVPDLAATSTAAAGSLPGMATWSPSGAIRFRGELGGSVADPVLSGELRGEGLALRGVEVGQLETGARIDRRGLTLRGAALSGPLAVAEATGNLPWDTGQEVTLAWEASVLDLDALSSLLGRPGLAKGNLAGSGRMFIRDDGPVVEASMTGDGLEVAGRSVDRLDLHASLSRSALTLERFALRGLGGSGELTAAGSAGLDRAGDGIAFRALGLDLAALTGREDLEGTLVMDGTVLGPLAAGMPDAEARWRIDGASFRDADSMDLEGEATLGKEGLVLEVRDGDGRLEGEARLALADDLLVESRLRVGGMAVPLADPPDGSPLTASFTEGRLEVRGPLRRPDVLAGNLTVEGLAFRHGEAVLAGQGPARVVLGEGRARLEPLSLAWAGHTLEVEGEATLSDPPRWGLRMRGETRLEAFPPPAAGVRQAGLARLDLRLEGEGVRARPAGSLEVENGYLKLPDFPHALDGVRARAVFTPERVNLEELSARLGGGSLRGSGEVDLRGLRPSRWTARLEGTGVALRVPEGLNWRSDFVLSLDGKPEGSLLSGTVRLDRARYTRPMRLEKSLVTGRAGVEGPGAESFLDRYRLDLRVDAPGSVWIDNDLARAEFRADLKVGGTASRPLPDGEVELARPGTFRFGGIHYALTQARFDLEADRPGDPLLDLAGETAVGVLDVRIAVDGRLSDPKIVLSSDPDLPQEQLLAVLASRGLWMPEGVDRGSGLQLERSRAPLRERKGAPDIFQVSRQEGAEGDEYRVTVGEKIGDRVTATYSSTLGSNQEGAVEIRYRVLPSLELLNSVRQDGSMGAEALYVKSFRTGGAPDSEDVPAASAAEEGPRILIESVQVSGAPDPPGEDALRRALGLEPGTVAGRRDLILARGAAHALLAETGRPLARVECDEPDFGAAAGAGRPFVCRIDAGPLVRLEVEGPSGAKQADAIAASVRRAWQELAMPGQLVPEAEEAARRHLRAKGRARAEAEGSETGEDGSLVVRLRVRPGPRVRVRRVVLEGLEEGEQQGARAVLSSTRKVFGRGPVLVPDLLDGDRRALETHLFQQGHLDARVAPPRVALPEEDDRADLTFEARKGPRYRLAGVALEGEGAEAEEDLLQRLQPGSWADPAALEELTREVRADYDRRGHPDARIDWRLHRLGEERRAGDGAPLAEARIAVSPGPLVRVGDVRVEGNRSVGEDLVLLEADLQTGGLFSRAALLDAGRRLRNMQLFRTVSVRGADRPDDPAVRDVRIEVEERDNLDLGLGAGLNDEEGLFATFSLADRMLARGRVSAGFGIRYGDKTREGRVQVKWRRPWDAPGSLLWVLGLQSEDLPGFTAERRGFGMQYSRGLGRRTSAQYRYDLSDIRVGNVEAPQEIIAANEGLLSGLGFSWVRDHRDDPMDAVRGGLTTASATLNAEALGGDWSFLKLRAKQSWYRPLLREQVLYVLGVQVGIAPTFAGTEAVPASELFYAGGMDSVRGFRTDRLGPLSPLTGERGGGESLFVLSQEVRYPARGRVSLAAFLDAGNVWRDLSGFNPLDSRLAAGPGVLVRTPLGPFRIYYGWKLDPQPDEDPGRINFAFGPGF